MEQNKSGREVDAFQRECGNVGRKLTGQRLGGEAAQEARQLGGEVGR